MTRFTTYLAAAAAIGALAAPAAAQYYPQTYPQQQYPQGYPPQAYPGTPTPYGYGQGYNQGTTGNPITDIIDTLLGNRYNVNDRQAVKQCANAARAQAAQQYGGGYSNAYGNGYRQQGYAGANLRVTSITEVQRRGNGLRVSGTMGSGAGYGGGQYGYQNGYQNRGYANASLSFRCNVAYNGAVTGIRIRPANAY